VVSSASTTPALAASGLPDKFKEIKPYHQQNIVFPLFGGHHMGVPFGNEMTVPFTNHCRGQERVSSNKEEIFFMGL